MDEDWLVPSVYCSREAIIWTTAHVWDRHKLETEERAQVFCTLCTNLFCPIGGRYVGRFFAYMYAYVHSATT